MNPPRVGVIGAGIMGSDHARILHRFVSGAVLTRVTDVDPARARDLAATLRGVEVADDALALIADREVDAVVIASSDDTHAGLVVAATRAGKPVLCEKPLAPTLEQAVEVVRTLETEGTLDLLALGFMRRFDPAYVALRSALASGAIGPALVVHCISRGVASSPVATSASSVTGSAVHEFDTVPWLLGVPITQVAWFAPRCSATAQELTTGLQDPQVILLRTGDGALTTVEVFLNARYGYDIRCEVVGESGALSLPDASPLVQDVAGHRSAPYPSDWRPRFAEAYRLELQAWVDGVTAGARSDLATAHDGLRAALVSEAVLRSMESGGGWVGVADAADAVEAAESSEASASARAQVAR